MILFPPFQLDPSNQQLWRGLEQVTLKPKAFAVLRYLVERPRQLITKEELLERFWSDVHVGDAVLKTHMADIRRALGDDIKSPRFIETAHRRGYRFIAALDGSGPAGSSVTVPTPAPSSSSAAAAKPRGRQRSSFVGRELELERLEASLSRALEGPLQAVFVTGEAGAGKTTLANEFLTRLEARGDLRLARGQCVEQYGASEAYLPVLEALGRLCRQGGKERIIEVLRKQAPSWLSQLPGVLDTAEQAALQDLGLPASNAQRASAFDVSSDGFTVLVAASGGSFSTFRWTQARGHEVVQPRADGFAASTFATDATILVGEAGTQPHEPFIWTSATGFRTLASSLPASALPAGYRFQTAVGEVNNGGISAVSDNGSVLAAFALNPSGELEAVRVVLGVDCGAR